jgi:hypothetical protein
MLEFNVNRDLYISSFTIANDNTDKATLEVFRIIRKSGIIKPYAVSQKEAPPSTCSFV